MNYNSRIITHKIHNYIWFTAPFTYTLLKTKLTGMVPKQKGLGSALI